MCLLFWVMCVVWPELDDRFLLHGLLDGWGKTEESIVSEKTFISLQDHISLKQCFTVGNPTVKHCPPTVKHCWHIYYEKVQEQVYGLFKSCSNPVVQVLFEFCLWTCSNPLVQVLFKFCHFFWTCSKRVLKLFKTGSTVGQNIQIFLFFFLTVQSRFLKLKWQLNRILIWVSVWWKTKS